MVSFNVGNLHKHFHLYTGSCHSHDANFFVKCGIKDCTRSYSNYASFRKHLKRKHPEVVSSDQEESEQFRGHGDFELRNDGEEDMQMADSSGGNMHSHDVVANLQDSAYGSHQRALFLLKSKEVHKMSEQALCDIMTDFTVMIDDILDDVYREVEKKLVANNVLADDIGLREVFNDAKFKYPFEGLSSEYLRSKYYVEHMNLVVCKQFCLLSFF